MADSKLDVLHGTLDVMVLHTLEVMGPQHGYGIARRIEQLSDAIAVLRAHHRCQRKRRRRGREYRQQEREPDSFDIEGHGSASCGG